MIISQYLCVSKHHTPLCKHILLICQIMPPLNWGGRKSKHQGKVRTSKELGQDFSVSEADSTGTEWNLLKGQGTSWRPRKFQFHGQIIKDRRCWGEEWKANDVVSFTRPWEGSLWGGVRATAASTFWPALTASPRSSFLYYVCVTGPTVLLSSHCVD